MYEEGAPLKPVSLACGGGEHTFVQFRVEKDFSDNFSDIAVSCYNSTVDEAIAVAIERAAEKHIFCTKCGISKRL